MSKIYGVSVLINSLIIFLMSAAWCYIGIVEISNTGFESKKLLPIGVGTLLIYLVIKFVIRCIRIFNGSLIIASPKTDLKKVIFIFGMALLAISAAIQLCTLVLAAYLLLTKTAGVPAGMGFGLGLILFLLSVFPLGLSIQLHNNLPQPAAKGRG